MCLLFCWNDFLFGMQLVLHHLPDHAMLLYSCCKSLQCEHWILLNHNLFKAKTLYISAGEDDTLYIHSASGLFPLPIAKHVKPSILFWIKSKFQFVGKFLAKALVDSRMVCSFYIFPFLLKNIEMLNALLMLSRKVVIISYFAVLIIWHVYNCIMKMASSFLNSVGHC